MPRPHPLDKDPGWNISPRKLLLFMVPGYLAKVGKANPDGLVLTRQIFTSFVSSLILFQLSLLVIGTTDAPTEVGWAIGLLALGVVDVFVFGRIAGRKATLDCTDHVTLASSYRTRFFLRVAFAQSAALFGFVGFFIANVWWVYPASLLTTAFGYARLAPTKANLAADQQELRSRGCDLSLVRALRDPKAA